MHGYMRDFSLSAWTTMFYDLLGQPLGRSQLGGITCRGGGRGACSGLRAHPLRRGMGSCRQLCCVLGSVRFTETCFVSCPRWQWNVARTLHQLKFRRALRFSGEWKGFFVQLICQLAKHCRVFHHVWWLCTANQSSGMVNGCLNSKAPFILHLVWEKKHTMHTQECP